ncbi:MAG TPA: hypothetical protein DCZ72_12775 [Armatimonadetes bacterium]|nr:hypothetical protein [Armatimonadota bacterium]
MGAPVVEEFERFIKKQTEARRQDWDARQRFWLEAVRQLYADVRSWLQSHVDAQAMECVEVPRTLVETDLGRYEVPALEISGPGFRASLEPVGIKVRDALGRVDLDGLMGSVRLLLVPADREAAPHSRRRIDDPPALDTSACFKIVTEAPHFRYLELTKERFLAALLYVVGARAELPEE